MSGAAVHGAEVVCAGLVHVYRAAGVDTAALRGVDLTVAPGQQLALLGPSGSGKSTLLTLLSGIRQPSAGKILLDGTDIARLPDRQLRAYRAATVGTLLQGAAGNLLDYATALDNVRHAQRARSRRDAARPAAALLDTVGVSGRAQSRPVRTLSPGQQQATAAAVALANNPRLLVADEPTSQLDPAGRDALLTALLDVLSQTGTTVIVVTHDSEVAARLHRTVHLRDGRVGAEEVARERFAVLGADYAVQLPEHLVADWPPGSRLRVTRGGPDELRITRQDQP